MGGLPTATFGAVEEPLARQSRANHTTKSKRPSKATRETGIVLARSPGPPALRLVLVLMGSLYVAAVFMEGVGASLHRIVYRPILFFCQIAALFPHAATHTIEYRAEGYTCSGRVIEIDVRPYFPIHADDKESRFDRAMFFYRNDRATMEALEAYVMGQYNRSEQEKIGGVVFMSLRVPIPAPGSSFSRYRRTPLSDHPSEQRKVWYVTPHDTVLERCRQGSP
jgi:hypothetical protein